MSVKITVKLDKKKLQMLTPETDKRAKLLLDKYAFMLGGWAQRFVRVDTGATRASIYVSGAKANRMGYGAAKTISAALAKLSGRRQGIWWTDEVGPKDEFERVIGASTWYAEVVEYVHGSFLRAALIKIKPGFLKAWEKIFDWTR